ncbi:MAG: hypothetical protein HC831_22565 [Chloroflexia bacterium]|nr:hypothetical protein [Chloroflexia bacterium]
MESTLKNQFVEIIYSAMNNLVLQTWLTSSSHMCELEFRRQIELLFGFVDFFQPEAVYIDASEFCYYINEKAVQLINQYLQKCKIISFGLVISSALLGKEYIKKMVREVPGKNLKLFKTRNEGKSWLSSNFGLNNQEN